MGGSDRNSSERRRGDALDALDAREAREAREALVWSGDQRGVVCIHGFTATHLDMRFLAEALHARGMTVVAPLLPGHHTLPTDLDVTTWRDWFGAVQQTFDEVSARCPAGVAVVGQSLGGLLALHLAAHGPEQLRGVASLATPLWLERLPTLVAKVTQTFPVLTRLVPMLPKRGGVDVCDPVAKAASISYPVIPVRALHQLVELMAVVRGELDRVRSPLLVLHSRQDHTAPFACSTALARGVSSATVEHRALDRSFHNLSIDVERDLVADTVIRFVESHFLDPRVRSARSESCAT